jgi:hypothetical protein
MASQTHNLGMNEENKVWHCLASTPTSYTRARALTISCTSIASPS